MAIAAALLGTGCAQAAPDRAHPVLRRESAGAAGAWGRAIAVPGLAALNKGRNAVVLSVSCPSAGNCGAGGYYHDRGRRGFVVSESNGRWRQAIQVPGLAALSKGEPGQVIEVSCASAGSCAAGGFYRYGSGHHQGFVVSRSNGRWRQAIQVPGLAALNEGGDAEVISVSCASPASCAAVGFYTDGSGHQQGFVVSRSNGRWRPAIEVPGLAALRKGPYARVQSVSCASAGNCSAGGSYAADASGRTQAFVVSERNGSWGTAQEAAANLSTGSGGDTAVDTVSCGSPGNCAAGGQYSNAAGDQAFVISEVNGTWAAARAVAGTLSSSGGAQVTSVSCASAGNCAAGGQFDYGGYNAAFLVNEKNGSWGKLMYVPGLNAVSRDAYLNSVSCASPGNCAVGGDYDLGVFVAIEKNGVWGKETSVPGALRVEEVHSVSCASAGSCVAGGSYAVTGRGYQGFVT
ncbi:MAG TPA: hypothetical protein VF162_14065 [Streptosporangiaceae bacterium]